MKKLASLTGAVALVVAIGFGDEAMAQNAGVLTNGDAEDGTLLGWVATGGLASVSSQANAASETTLMGVETTMPFEGLRFFTMHGTGASPETETMDQDANVTGFEGKSFTASAWFQTAGGDTAGLEVKFFDGGSSQVGATFSATDLSCEVFEDLVPATLPGFLDPTAPGPINGDEYCLVAITGTIPFGAVTANYKVIGNLDFGSNMNVHFDALSFVHGSPLGLVGQDLAGADFKNADLSGEDLRSANLTGANLSRADLRDADLTGATLIDANLTRADLRDGDDPDDIGAILLSANLTRANLHFAKLTAADFTGANLTETNLRSATGLTAVNLTGVTWDATICPDGSNSDANGGDCLSNLTP